jgi:hypothetical protein
MIKRVKTAILILVHLLLLQGICGQTSGNMTNSLSQKFLQYCKSVPREEVFIHSDREEYVSGEDIWFNVYLIDRQSFKPSINSRIVYFEVLNTENRPVLQKRILIDNGFGPGQITLPDTLSTGTYTIRAYTSWMKNFLPYNCFTKDILIYNTLNTKAFKGKQSEVRYIRKGIKDLNPEIKNNGIKLRVNGSKRDSLEINITADEKVRSGNGSLFYIFIQTHGNINYVSAEKMVEETTRINIPRTLLSAGINQITIFDSIGKPVAERLVYTPARQNQFLAVHSADSCDLRSKVTLEIESAVGASADLDSSALSISVAPENKDEVITDINDYLVFGTEYLLEGNNPVRGIKDLTPEVIDSELLNIRSNWIDWETILNKDIPHFKYQIEKEDHLLSGRLISNDQLPLRSNELVLMNIPGKEAVFQYARTDIDGNFRFNISVDEELKDIIIMPDDISKNRKIVLGSSFSDNYSNTKLSVDSMAKPLTPYISKLSVNHQVQKIYGIPSAGNPSKPTYEALKHTRFYGKPDIELVLADYISLPVMNEIFFELLPGVSLKKKKNTFEISITYRVDDDLFVTSPCLMIDGVVIKDAGLISNLDPEIVEKIDVIREKYLVGKYFFPGIINVITKAGDFSCVSLPDYMIRMPYKVVDPVKSFVAPEYSSDEVRDSRIPDYRNTLYWNPSVKPDKDGKARVEFWSSDNKADYIIDIQGITKEGKTFSFQKILKVK